MTAKTVNYTVEQTAAIVADYNAGVSVDTIAAKVGKSVRSIVPKLSREGVYKAKERVSKTGAPVVKKDEIVDAMQSQFGLTDAEADSLTKANKTALVKILTKFVAENVKNVKVVDLTDEKLFE